MSRFVRCPGCREMISAEVGTCRFCGLAMTAEEALRAGMDQELVEGALGQAANLKYAGWVTLIFAALEVYFCVFADRIPIYFLVVQLAPAVGLFSSLNWLRKYGALQTDEPDYPEARRAMHRTTILWVAVFVLQFVLLGVLVFRVVAGRA